MLHYTMNKLPRMTVSDRKRKIVPNKLLAIFFKNPLNKKFTEVCKERYQRINHKGIYYVHITSSEK